MADLLDESKDNLVKAEASESIDEKLERELADGGTIDLERKWQDMKDLVTAPRQELDGMAICPFAKMGFKRNEVVVHWVGKDMFKIADPNTGRLSLGKQLVLCIGDPNDYTLEELEQWENHKKKKAVSNDLYIYTSITQKTSKNRRGSKKIQTNLYPGLGFRQQRTCNYTNTRTCRFE